MYISISNTQINTVTYNITRLFHKDKAHHFKHISSGSVEIPSYDKNQKVVGHPWLFFMLTFVKFFGFFRNMQRFSFINCGR